MIDTKKITPDFSSSTAFLKSGESLTLCENTVKDKTLIVMNARLERISGEAKLVVGHAYKEKRGGWLEIGEHTVSAYNHIPWKSPSDHPLFLDLPHGLLIKDFVTVVINKDMANGEYAEISTTGGSFKFSVSGIAGYDGSPIVTPEGLHLSEVSLSFTADAYRTPIWIYGDSYLSHNEDDRWPYYLYKNGYTNMLLRAVDADGTPYNSGQGWKTNTRLNSSGVESTSSAEGMECTGFIPFKRGDVIRFSGITMNKDNANSSRSYFIQYDSNKTMLKQWIVAGFNDAIDKGWVLVDDNYNILQINTGMFYDENGRIKHCPVVQVWWFERPMEIQDKVAKYLHNQFEKMGFYADQISFHIFEEDRYYENGEKC